MAQPGPIDIANAADFDALVKNNKYVIADFTASWCGPCKAIAPLYTQHAAKHTVENKIAFAKIDIDDVPDVAARFRITSVPTFVFMKDGEAFDDLKGASPPKLKAAIDDIVRESEEGGGSENALAKDINDEDW